MTKVLEIGGSSLLDFPYAKDFTKIYRSREPQYKSDKSRQMDINKITEDLEELYDSQAERFQGVEVELESPDSDRLRDLHDLVEDAEIVFLTSGSITNNPQDGILDDFRNHKRILMRNYVLNYNMVKMISDSRLRIHGREFSPASLIYNTKDVYGVNDLRSSKFRNNINTTVENLGTGWKPSDEFKLLNKNVQSPKIVVYISSVATDFTYPTRPNYFLYKSLTEDLITQVRVLDSVVEPITWTHCEGLLYPKEFDSGIIWLNIKLPATKTRMSNVGMEAEEFEEFYEEIRRAYESWRTKSTNAGVFHSVTDAWEQIVDRVRILRSELYGIEDSWNAKFHYIQHDLFREEKESKEKGIEKGGQDA